MSPLNSGDVTNPDSRHDNANTSTEHAEQQSRKGTVSKNYQGFVGGILSGMTKLGVGHPFDTVKVRLQTSQKSQFTGPIDCVLQTIRKEGLLGLYKGATPPLLGWMAIDSVMMGSLMVYRRFLQENVFSRPAIREFTQFADPIILNDRNPPRLPSIGHGIAGALAGMTASFVAAPIGHVAARLQTQYAAAKKDRLFQGPVDCTKKLIRTHGISGLYHGLMATMIFRAFFFFWWGSYDAITRFLQHQTSLSTPAVNFWAGGLSAQIFWVTSFPSDVVKQRIMTDPLGGALGDGERRFYKWSEAAQAVGKENGFRGYWRGFVPCFVRAFPANALALVVFEGIMRTLE